MLVGHSYGGAVITQAGTDAKNAVGLVFVAAFAPEAGESLGEINVRYPDVALGAALRPFTYTKEGGGQGTDLYADRALFQNAFCADVPAAAARLAAATQRPVAADAFANRSSPGRPRGRRFLRGRSSRPSDYVIHPDAERDMAKRAGCRDDGDRQLALRVAFAAEGRGRRHPPGGEGDELSARAT